MRCYSDRLNYKKFDGNSWSEEKSISDPIGICVNVPSITADSINNAHIAWADWRDDPTYGEIYYSKLDNEGNTLVNDLRLTDFPESSRYPRIDVDTQDNVHIVWFKGEYQGSYSKQLYYSKMNNSGSKLLNCIYLSEGQYIDDGRLMNPSLTVDTFNRLHVVFGDDRDGNLEIYYKSTHNYDLSINAEDIRFSNLLPKNGENIFINATINNDGGDLTNGTVYFYIDSIDDMNLIDSVFVSIPSNESDNVSIDWIAVVGTHTIWVKIESENGIVESNLTNNIASKEILVNDPPTISITAPPSGLVTIDDSYTISWVDNDPDDDAEIELYYDDDNTGFDGTLIDTSDQYPTGIVDANGASRTYDWDTSTLIDGSSWYIYAKIDDGIHEPVHSYSQGKVKIDHQNIAPNVEITSPTGGTVSGTVTIQGTASDDDGSVLVVEIKIDNMGWEEATGTTSWSHPWRTTDYTNGEHTIYARAKDDSELYSQEKSITVMVNNGGNIVPSVDFTSHFGGEVVGGNIKIKGTAQDHDGDVELVEIIIDDGNWKSATGTTSWTYPWDTTSYSNGEHVIYARAKDDFGEYSQIRSITLIVDNGGNIPPVITIISPTGGTVSGTKTIRGTASDLDGDSTISYVQVKIDDGDWEDTNGITEWSYSWDTTVLDDGNYTISVRAYDEIDYSMVKSVDVYVDNPHEPILSITSDIPDEVSGTITIKGSASDIDGEITKVEIQIDNGEWKEVEGTTDWSYELDTTKLSDGEHTVRIRVYDDEGEYTEDSFSIKVNNSNWIFWTVIAMVLIILVTLIVVGLVVRKRRGKSGISPVQAQQAVQMDTESVRCPQCNNVFVVVKGSDTIQCPYCGLTGTPVQTNNVL